MSAVTAAVSKNTVVKMEPCRRQRHKVHTDTIFDQLMEAHINSKREKKDGDDPSSPSQVLTLENFGARTGLNWPEGRVSKEIAGLIGGFTQEQEEKLTQMRNNGRAVAETLASTKEFNGRGNPELFPHKSKQQITAKILDMFGYVKLKSIVPVKVEATASRGRGGIPPSSSSSKVYVYQDGGGTATLEPAALDAAAAPTSSAVEGSNILHNISDAAYVDVPATSGYRPSPYSVGGRSYREQKPSTSIWDSSAPAKSSRFSRTTTPMAHKSSRFPKYGPTFSGGCADGATCSSAGGVAAETYHHGCDDMMGAVGSSSAGGVAAETYHRGCDDMMGAVGFFSAHGAGGGGGGGGIGMDGGRHPSRAGDGYAAVDGGGYLYPRSFPAPKLSPTPSRAHHRCMNSPVARDFYERDPEVSIYSMDEPAWNGGMEKLEGFPEWLVSPSSPPNHPAMMQKTSTICSTLMPPEVNGPNNMPHHSPRAVSSRFENGCSIMNLPPPLPVRPIGCYLPPSDRVRVRKKPRIPLNAITGVAMHRTPCVDGPTATFEAPSTSFDPFFSRRTEQSFDAVAEGATASGGEDRSTPACAAGAVASRGCTEKKSQLLKSFPASVSLAEQRSLRLAFGSALTEEAWLIGTSTLLGAELNLD